MAGTSTGVSLLTVGKGLIKNLSFWLDGSSLNESLSNNTPSGSLNFSTSSPVSAPLGSYYTTNGLTQTSLVYPNLGGSFNLASVYCTVGFWLKVVSGSPTTSNYELVRLASQSSSSNNISLVLRRAFGAWYIFGDSLYGQTDNITGISITPDVWTFVGLRAHTNGTVGFVEAFKYLGSGIYTKQRRSASGSSSYDLNQNPVVMTTNLRGTGTDFQMDSLGIWNVVLPDDELDIIVNSGNGLNYSQLQAIP